MHAACLRGPAGLPPWHSTVSDLRPHQACQARAHQLVGPTREPPGDPRCAYPPCKFLQARRAPRSSFPGRPDAHAVVHASLQPQRHAPCRETQLKPWPGFTKSPTPAQLGDVCPPAQVNDKDHAAGAQRQARLRHGCGAVQWRRGPGRTCAQLQALSSLGAAMLSGWAHCATYMRYAPATPHRAATHLAQHGARRQPEPELRRQQRRQVAQ